MLANTAIITPATHLFLRESLGEIPKQAADAKFLLNCFTGKDPFNNFDFSRTRRTCQTLFFDKYRMFRNITHRFLRLKLTHG